MGKWPSSDSFTSTLAKQVVATQSTPMSEQPLHDQHRQVYMFPKEEDESAPGPPAAKKVFDKTFK